MSDWALILTPLLVLPIVLLFRFIGCLPDLAPLASKEPPRYRDYIVPDAAIPNPGAVKNNSVVPKKEDVIAYWRLIDSDGAPEAKDEKGFQPGQYIVPGALPAELPTPAKPGSESAPGNFAFPQESLIVSDKIAHCRLFNGGHVMVPFRTGLYTHEFTIEAWIDVEWGANITDYRHTLFSAGEPVDASAAVHGFSVFSNGQNRWQVHLAPNAADVFASAPLVPRNARTHLAITVENEGSTGRKVRIFIDGKPAGEGSVNSYSLPDGAPLFIGVTKRKVDPAAEPVAREPILSRIQEVVLHKRALAQEEIENHFDINRS